MSFVVKDEPGAATMPTLEKQQEYWKYWQGSRSNSGWALERTDVVLELLRSLSLDQPRILDLGCGTGFLTEKLADFGEATGMDLNEEAMLEASARCPHINFIGGNLFEYPLDENFFDIVVSMQVIAHVEDQSAFIERVARLLRPGGYFLVSTNNKFVMDRLGDEDWGSHRQAGHIEKWLTVRSLNRLVSSGFHIVQTRTLLPMGNGGVLRIANSQKLNTVLGRLLPGGYLQRVKERLGLGYYIMLLAQKRPDKISSRHA